MKTNLSTKSKFRNLSGVLILNKDLKVSSNKALQQVRYLYQAAKAGHTGSLDPLATGVLPICFGEATKFASYLLDSDKTYIVTAQLGAISSTGDCEGEISETGKAVDFSDQTLKEVINSFLGKTLQTPSMYSALKHNGQPLYKLARQGIDVPRAAREIFIHYIKILTRTSDTVKFEVRCTKGTYIRNLIEDIGSKLGCGAYVLQLQRIQAGMFSMQQSYTLEQLKQLSLSGITCLDQLLLPVKTLLNDMPQMQLNHIDSQHLIHGRSIVIKHSAAEGEFCLVDETNSLLGVGTALNDGRIIPKRMLSSNASDRNHADAN
jgi:tRNA pseudouridine55 synthase